MDILNFIHWVKNRRVISQAPKGSLIPIGVKDPRRDDKYLTCAIPVESLGGGLDIETITVDMNVGPISISNNNPDQIDYVFAGVNTFQNAKSSIISLSDGSYLIGSVNSSAVPA